MSGFLREYFSLFITFSLSLSPSFPLPLPLTPSALLVICWHSGMPHHPYRSSLLICSLICLDGRRQRGTRMKVTKVWRETIKQGDSVGGEEGAKKKKKKKRKICWVVNQVWWNPFACRLTVREFLITHCTVSECSDTSTLMPHVMLPGAHQHSDKNNIFHLLWWQSPHTPPVKHLQGSEIAAFWQSSHDRCRVSWHVC